MKQNILNIIPIRTISVIICFLILCSATPLSASIQKAHVAEIVSTEMYTVRGRILYAGESTLVLFLGDSIAASDLSDTELLILHCSEIESIKIIKNNRSLSGLGWGILIGGTIGIVAGLNADDSMIDGWMSRRDIVFTGGYLLGTTGAIMGAAIGGMQGKDYKINIRGDSNRYRRSLPKLKKYSIPSSCFSDKQKKGLPENIRIEYAENLEEDTVGVRPPNFPSNDDSLITEIGQKAKIALNHKVHISFTGSFVISNADNHMMSAYRNSDLMAISKGFFGTISYPENETIPFSIYYELLYNVHPKIRAGIAYFQLIRPKVEGPDSEYEEMRGTNYSLIIDCIPKPVLNLSKSKKEFSIGAGISYNILHVKGSIMKDDYSSNYGDLLHENIDRNQVYYSFNKKVFGAFLRCGTEGYLSRDMSLIFQISVQWFPAINIPQQSYTFYYEDYFSGQIQPVTTTLKAHQVNMSSINIGIGLRLHMF